MKNIGLFFLLYFWAPMGSASLDSGDYTSFLEQLTESSETWSESEFGAPQSLEQKRRLRQFAPQMFVHKESCKPMDFYKQYVPQLRIGDNELPGTRQLLKKFERNFELKYQIKSSASCLESAEPPLYAYSWKELVKTQNGETQDIHILKYAHAFFKSGLPKKRSWIQKVGSVLGDSELWHYLDIHGGVFYILDPQENLLALVIAQHNHFRTYIVGKDITLAGAKNICFAQRSNEPYICDEADKKSKHPTAPTAQDMEWIVGGKNRPFMGAWDLVPPPEDRVSVNYKFEFLTLKDPLITSWRSLGPNIKIWGLFSTFFRNAPPGMAIFNSPKLKSVWKTAQYFYFDPKNQQAFEVHRENAKDFFNWNVGPILKINGTRFRRQLKDVQPNGPW